MRNSTEFNDKYKNYIEEGHYGMAIDIPAVVSYVDTVFQDLIKIEGFQFSQIKTKYGLSRVYTNLHELMPFVGRIIGNELEEKINFILKVEFEIENRLKSINLDKYGKPLQSL
jgi:hypothetical protein